MLLHPSWVMLIADSSRHYSLHKVRLLHWPSGGWSHSSRLAHVLFLMGMVRRRRFGLVPAGGIGDSARMQRRALVGRGRRRRAVRYDRELAFGPAKGFGNAPCMQGCEIITAD